MNFRGAGERAKPVNGTGGPVKGPGSGVILLPPHPGYDRRKGGEASHLSDAAIACILQCILLGKSNGVINRELQKGGHIGDGEEVSGRTLATYRKDPRAKVQRDRLTDEALQTGHVLLSNSIVQAVETADALAPYVQIAPGELFPHEDLRTLKMLSEMQKGLWSFVWDKLGSPGLMDQVEASQDEILDKVNQAKGLSEIERREIIVAVKMQLAKILKQAVMAHSKPAAEGA